MKVCFKLIKINIILTILRPACIFLTFLPILLGVKLSEIILGIWIVTSLCIYVFLVISYPFFIKRFKVIGKVNLNESNIEITQNNGEIFNYTPGDRLKIIIKINGYRGESTQVFFIAISEGIGSIEIEEHGRLKKFNILANKNFRKELGILINKYSQMGSVVSLLKY
jgi:hypothetical protein